MNIETIKSVYFVVAGGIGMSALVRSCSPDCGKHRHTMRRH